MVSLNPNHTPISIKNILILLSKEATLGDTHLSLVLLAGLKKLGKTATVQQGNGLRENLFSPSVDHKKTFVVSLKGISPWISKIQYEKSEKDVKLYFTLQDGEVSPEALALQVQNQTDLTIIVGEKSQKNNLFPYAGASFLWAEEARDALFELLTTHENGEHKMFGHILGKLQFAERLDLYLTSLAPEDFAESRVEQKTLVALLEELQQTFSEQASYLFLFQAFPSTLPQGLAWTKNPAVKKLLHGAGQTQEKGNWILLSLPNTSIHQLTYALLS